MWAAPGTAAEKGCVVPLILVTNDDGISSPGLLALKQQLEPIGEVVVLAPERNWSATSHAKTMHKPMRITAVSLADGSQGYTCSGSPTDCVAMAMGGALGAKPDLVVSGINTGHNIGIDITYSGTVACAMEAVILGVPGVAVSTSHPSKARGDYAEIVRFTGDVARDVTERVHQAWAPRADADQRQRTRHSARGDPGRAHHTHGRPPL